MTTDERLDRLTERHEALTGHVEILTADVAQLTSAVSKMQSRMDDLMTGFSTLVELARSHKIRIGRLESRWSSARRSKPHL
jgi:prefoldin subunit 5